jgi:hypothetical protein
MAAGRLADDRLLERFAAAGGRRHLLGLAFAAAGAVPGAAGAVPGAAGAGFVVAGGWRWCAWASAPDAIGITPV